MPSNKETHQPGFVQKILNNIDWTKLTTALITALATIICAFGSIYLKHSLNSQDKTSEVTKRLNDSRVVTARIETIRNKINADRVSISQFHNGIYFKNGNSFERISTTHEVAANGISMSGENFQGLPITLFEDVFSKINKNNFVKYVSTDSIPNIALAQLLSDNGVRSTYLLKMTDINDDYTGFLQIDFVKEPKDLSQKKINNLINESIALGAYLSNKNSNTKTLE